MTTLKELIVQAIVTELDRQYDVDCGRAYIPAGDPQLDDDGKRRWCLDGYYDFDACADSVISAITPPESTTDFCIIKSKTGTWYVGPLPVKTFTVVRRGQQESEGNPIDIQTYTTEKEAQDWIDAQEGQFYKPWDYFIRPN